MASSDDKHPKRIQMKVEEIADEKEEKKVSKEDSIPPAVPPPSLQEEEKEEEKEEMPLEGLAREQQEQQKEVLSAEKETPKKDIVSELFRTNESAVNYPDVTVQKKSKKFSTIIWVFLLFIIVGCIGGGLLLFKQQSSSGNQLSPQGGSTPMVTPATSLSPTEMQTPTPAASASAEKKEITIQIWNGSGKSGAASLMKELLEEKGYTVKSTGNAPSFSKEKTAIYVKKSKKDYLDLLKADIGEKYSLGTTSATLDETLTVDARVIVGEE